MKRHFSILTLCLTVLPASGSLWAQDPPIDPEARAALGAMALAAFEEAYEARRGELEREGRLVTADISPAEAAAMPVVEAAKVTDAAVTAPTPNSASTTRDLLSFLVGAFDLGELSEDDTMNLVLALNPKFFDFDRGQGSGKVTFREPAIFEALALELPEDLREVRKLALLDGLDEFDDVDIFATWSKEGGRFGRDPSDYVALTESLGDVLEAGESVQERQDMLAAIEGFADPTVVERLAREAGVSAAEGLADLWRTYTEARYFHVGDLIANQPQLYFDLNGRFRDPLVGRDEYGLKATGEFGFGNVNGLLRTCAPGRSWSKQERVDRLKSVSASCYTGFVEDHAEDWSKRVVLKIEYSRTDAYDHDLPDDDVSLDLDSAHTFRITGGLGFDLAPLPETGNSPPRLDFEAMYEDVSDDEVRNDHRFFATLTYTQKMSPSSSTSLSLVYASKPEFLGEVDEEFSAHVGLKIKVDSKQATGST